MMIFSLTACSSGGVSTQKSAAELLDIVLNSVEFPEITRIDDEQRINEMMGIDLSEAEDWAVVQQLLSVDVVEVILIKPKADASTDYIAELQARKNSLINDFAFYPNQVESAEATVVGKKNGVSYLICHADASEAETRLLAALES